MEQQLAQTDGTLSTLEFQREAIENATTNAEVLRTMELAAQGLKNLFHGCLLILFMNSLAVQKLLSLIKSHLFIFIFLTLGGE